MKVEKMISYEKAKEYKESFGGMGGFFGKGMRWEDYIKQFKKEVHKYAEAIRVYFVKNEIKHGGDWHQGSNEGVPLFSDNTVATFTYRAWGDISAAIWSTEENKDYSYMDFYME